MFVPKLIAIHPTVIRTFLAEPQMLTSWWWISPGLTKVIRIHRLGTTNVCRVSVLIHLADVKIFYQVSKTFDMMMELEGKSGSTK